MAGKFLESGAHPQRTRVDKSRQDGGRVESRLGGGRGARLECHRQPRSLGHRRAYSSLYAFPSFVSLPSSSSILAHFPTVPASRIGPNHAYRSIQSSESRYFALSLAKLSTWSRGKGLSLFQFVQAYSVIQTGLFGPSWLCLEHDQQFIPSAQRNSDSAYVDQI